MKKLVTAFAACALAALGFAQVESQNIVGYTTADLAEGFNMIGVNFEAVGATDGQVDIQDLVDATGLTGVDWGSGTGGDQLMIWDPANQYYPKFYSWTGADADTQLGNTGESVNNKWVDLGTFGGTIETVPPLKVPAGSAAWIVRTTATAASLTFSGQVKQDGGTQALSEGFNMFANALPTVLDMNSSAQITCTGLTGVDWGSGTGGDQLMIWDPVNQYYPKFYSWTGADADTQLGNTGESVNNKWVDLGTFGGTIETVPPVTIPVGGGAWIVRTTATAASITTAGL